jgi:hypothetical protein
MPKKRQTRQHKIRSNQRQIETSAPDQTETTVSAPVYSLSQTNIKISPKPRTHTETHSTTIVTSHYQYLAGDLRKTVLLMIGIAAAELFLFYFIKGV